MLVIVVHVKRFADYNI
jgi:hypothetical protein